MAPVCKAKCHNIKIGNLPILVTPFQIVHSDLAGPITTVSKEATLDDFSGAFGVYFLKNKSDATMATEQFLADTAPYGSVKRLRSDNGGEYISEEFKPYC